MPHLRNVCYLPNLVLLPFFLNLACFITKRVHFPFSIHIVEMKLRTSEAKGIGAIQMDFAFVPLEQSLSTSSVFHPQGSKRFCQLVDMLLVWTKPGNWKNKRQIPSSPFLPVQYKGTCQRRGRACLPTFTECASRINLIFMRSWGWGPWHFSYVAQNAGVFIATTMPTLTQSGFWLSRKKLQQIQTFPQIRLNKFFLFKISCHAKPSLQHTASECTKDSKTKISNQRNRICCNSARAEKEVFHFRKPCF